MHSCLCLEKTWLPLSWFRAFWLWVRRRWEERKSLLRQLARSQTVHRHNLAWACSNLFDVPCTCPCQVDRCGKAPYGAQYEAQLRDTVLLFTSLIPDIPDLTHFSAPASTNSAFSRQSKCFLKCAILVPLPCQAWMQLTQPLKTVP